MEALPEGLRERKKRATREAIASTARRLFAERGYDEVTVAEVAAAANVSEKTVFNYFESKLDLAFAGRDRHLPRLFARISGRPSGSSVLDVFRATTEEMLDNLAAGGDDDFFTFPQIIGRSRTLQEQMRNGGEREAAALTAVVAEAAGAEEGDPLPDIVARTLSLVHQAIFRAALTALLAGEERDRLVARLRIDAARAYDQLAGGIGDYAARG